MPKKYYTKYTVTMRLTNATMEFTSCKDMTTIIKINPQKNYYNNDFFFYCMRFQAN